ncbi:MAG: hypothetical protein ACFFAS_07125 [Promethearchaeota archaeon]
MDSNLEKDEPEFKVFVKNLYQVVPKNILPKKKGLVKTLHLGKNNGHDGPVTSLAISPDDKYLASGSWDQTIKLWDIKSKKLLKTIEAHEDWLGKLKFTPDGKFLISIVRYMDSQDKKNIKVWDVERGKIVKIIKAHEDGVGTFNITPDGSYLISIGEYDNKVRIWKFPSGKLIKEISDLNVNSVIFSPDAKYMIFALFKGIIEIREFPSNKLIQRYKNYENLVNTRETSPDADYIASCSGSHASRIHGINIWGWETGRLIWMDVGEPDWTIRRNAVAISRDNKFLINGADKGLLQIWDLEKGSLVKSLEGLESDVNSVVISNDGRYLFSACSDHNITIWDFIEKKPIYIFEGNNFILDKALGTSNNKLIANITCSQTSPTEYFYIDAWDLVSGNFLRAFRRKGLQVKYYGKSEDGKFMLTGSDDNVINIWSINSGKVVKSLDGFLTKYERSSRIKKPPVVSFDMNYFAMKTDHLLTSWNLITGQKISEIEVYEYFRVDFIGISPNGKYMLTYSKGHPLKLWQMQKARLCWSANAPNSFISSYLFSLEDDQVITGMSDGQIKFWDLKDGKLLKTLKTNMRYVTSLILSSDRKYLISVSNSKEVIIWDMTTKKRHWSLKSFREVVSIFFIENTHLFAICDEGGQIDIWDATLEESKNIPTEIEDQLENVENLITNNDYVNAKSNLETIMILAKMYDFESINGLALEKLQLIEEKLSKGDIEKKKFEIGEPLVLSENLKKIRQLEKELSLAPEIKEIMDKIIKLDKILDESAGMARGLIKIHPYAKQLSKLASKEVLINLLKYPDPLIQAYAFKALTGKKGVNLFKILSSNLENYQNVEIQFIDLITHIKVSDYFINIAFALLSEEERVQLDELLLFGNYKLNNVSVMLRNLEPKEKYYSQVKSLVLEKNIPDALSALARYKREDDLDAILQYQEKSLDETFKAIEQFPHPHFINFLKLYSRKNLEICEQGNLSYYEAVASYKNEEAVKIFEFPFGIRKRDHLNEYLARTLFEALSKHRTEIYIPLLFKLWEEENQINLEVFEFLHERDKTHSLNAIKKWLRNVKDSCCWFGFIKKILDAFIEDDRDSAIEVINEYLLSGDQTNLWAFTEKAEIIKDETFIPSIFQRLRIEMYPSTGVELIKIIQSYGRDDLNDKMGEIIAKNSELNDNPKIKEALKA